MFTHITPQSKRLFRRTNLHVSFSRVGFLSWSHLWRVTWRYDDKSRTSFFPGLRVYDEVCFRASERVPWWGTRGTRQLCDPLGYTAIFVGSSVAPWLKAESPFQPDKPGFESCLLPDTLHIGEKFLWAPDSPSAKMLRMCSIYLMKWLWNWIKCYLQYYRMALEMSLSVDRGVCG